MKFDPTESYSQRNMDIPQNLALHKFKELVVNLITIGSEAGTQKSIIGPIGAVADEMAVDFDTYFTRSYPLYVEFGLLNAAQVEKLLELDQFFNQHSGSAMPDFWKDDQLDKHPDWAIARSMANAILGILKLDDVRLICTHKEIFENMPTGRRLVAVSTQTSLVR